MSDYSQLFYSCKEVSTTCPVQGTVLGYRPNLGVNIVLAVGFGLCALTAATIGIWKKTWIYTAGLVIGCILELSGYIGRIIMHRNPWNNDAFQLQIVVIILGPTLLCISIYSTIGHVCRVINPTLSRLRPSLYLYMFIPADICCLLLQAIGGSLAAAAGHENYTMLENGNRTIIAGISAQVVVLGVFGGLSSDYLRRTNLSFKGDHPLHDNLIIWKDRRFRLFCGAVTAAYAAIMVRCIYRIAEMAGGWGNTIMRDEPSFIALEGFSILIGALALAAFQPGILFPQMLSQENKERTEGAH